MTLTPRSTFRIVATAEAVSWAGLLVGMFFKWVLKTSQLGVQVFGPIHGTIFIAYLVTVLLVSRRLRWSLRTLLIAGAASVPPFATLWFEIWADRRGLLTPAPAPAPQAAAERVPTAS